MQILALILAAMVVRAEDPALLVKAADEIRNPAESFFMKVKIEDDDRSTTYDVFLKGQDKTLIVTKEPAKDRGKNMLMLDRDFHAYVPNLKKSVKLSLAQKLSGQVANGDISRTRWFGDYAVTLEKAESSKENQLLLKANKPNLTYEWIRLWLEKGTNRPLRAEYLGLNGKTVLKQAFFEDYKSMAGAERPGVLRIQDPAGHKSLIRIEAMEKRTYDESYFTVRNMESIH